MVFAICEIGDFIESNMKKNLFYNDKLRGSFFFIIRCILSYLSYFTYQKKNVENTINIIIIYEISSVLH